MLENRNNRHVLSKIISASFLVYLLGCGSNKLNNNLDTTITAEGSNIIFAWSEQHPFAREYQNQPISLVAEYEEVGPNGRFRKVRQVLAHSRRQNIQEGGKRLFGLPKTLPSLASNRGVCLYLETNRRAIPIRTAGNFGTARFRYIEWEKYALNKTKDNLVGRDLQTAKMNLQRIEAATKLRRSQETQNLENLQRQLLQENVISETKVTRREECQAIRLENSKLTKPNDVFATRDIPSVAAKVCVHRVRYAAEHEYSSRVSKLPYVYFKMGKNRMKIEGMTAARNKQYDDTYSLFSKYFFNVGTKSGYQPPLGKATDGIGISKYGVDLGQGIYAFLKKKEPLTSKEEKVLAEVIALELEAFGNCVSEAKTQLETKKKAWLATVKAEPVRSSAKRAFIIKKCNDHFIANKRHAIKHQASRQKAEQDLARVQAIADEIDHSLRLPSKEILLNQESCSLN